MCSARSNIILLLCLPLVKLIVCLTTILNIRNVIEDRANYLYVILFSEIRGDVVGLIFVLISFYHIIEDGTVENAQK